MWKEFKEFAFKGNVLDLAIAVVIGAAFSKIVDALVASVIMPLLSLVTFQRNISALSFTVIKTEFPIGIFFQAVIDFLLVALVLFLVVKSINRIRRKQEAEAASAPEPSEDILLLREIRDALKARP